MVKEISMVVTEYEGSYMMTVDFGVGSYSYAFPKMNPDNDKRNFVNVFARLLEKPDEGKYNG